MKLQPGPHTQALRYSRLERLHFRLVGRWPERVVDRRLAASTADEEHARREFLKRCQW